MKFITGVRLSNRERRERKRNIPKDRSYKAILRILSSSYSCYRPIKAARNPTFTTTPHHKQAQSYPCAQTSKLRVFHFACCCICIFWQWQ